MKEIDKELLRERNIKKKTVLDGHWAREIGAINFKLGGG